MVPMDPLAVLQMLKESDVDQKKSLAGIVQHHSTQASN